MLEVELTAVKLHVAPVGSPAEHVKLTFPVNPVCGVIVIVELPLCPALTDIEVGLGERENPGTVTVKLAGTWADVVPEVPLTVTIVVPAGVFDEV